MESITGKALVASPYLTEQSFLRSVVYILRHDDEGAFGLILNRPTSMRVGELLELYLGHSIENTEPICHGGPEYPGGPEYHGSPEYHGGRVYHGGPVEGPLLALHDRVGGGSEEFDFCSHLGLHIATDQTTLVDLWQKRDCRFRTFNGYSGWGAGQLESELKAGGWLVWDAPPEAVFADPEPMWKQAVQQIGRDILGVQIDASRIPIDPAVN